MNPFTTLPAALVALLAPLLLLCLACLIWAILPRRAPGIIRRRDAGIARQIATLRKGADHAVTHRPRVRATSAPAFKKPAPPLPPPPAPKACGGGLCRKRADCADHHCPGVLEARMDAKLAARSVANSH